MEGIYNSTDPTCSSQKLTAAIFVPALANASTTNSRPWPWVLHQIGATIWICWPWWKLNAWTDAIGEAEEKLEDAGWNSLNFIFCLLNLHGFAHFTIKWKTQIALPAWPPCEIQQSHLLKKFRNTSRWKWQPFPTKPPRRYPSDPPPNSSRQQNKTVRGCCEKSTVYMTLPSASTNMTHSRFHLEIHSAEPWTPWVPICKHTHPCRWDNGAHCLSRSVVTTSSLCSPTAVRKHACVLAQRIRWGTVVAQRAKQATCRRDKMHNPKMAGTRAHHSCLFGEVPDNWWDLSAAWGLPVAPHAEAEHWIGGGKPENPDLHVSRINLFTPAMGLGMYLHASATRTIDACVRRIWGWTVETKIFPNISGSEMQIWDDFVFVNYQFVAPSPIHMSMCRLSHQGLGEFAGA